jgi:hypothetical protein
MNQFTSHFDSSFTLKRFKALKKKRSIPVICGRVFMVCVLVLMTAPACMDSTSQDLEDTTVDQLITELATRINEGDELAKDEAEAIQAFIQAYWHTNESLRFDQVRIQALRFLETEFLKLNLEFTEQRHEYINNANLGFALDELNRQYRDLEISKELGDLVYSQFREMEGYSGSISVLQLPPEPVTLLSKLEK